MFSLNRRNIRIAVSPHCNSDCLYCDGQKSRKINKPGAMEDFRRQPLKSGVIDTKTFLEIIKALHSSGFDGMTLTGGEPLLNPDWDKIVSQSHRIGMSRIGVTTNGLLLNNYLHENKYLPRELTLLTISLDTVDPFRFQAITGKDKFKEILHGLKLARRANPTLLIRANKILLHSDMNSLLEYIDYVDNTHLIDEINLLNLILKDRESKNFFEKEFISAAEVLDFFQKNTKYRFSMDDKYEYSAVLSSGLKIILKDTNYTLRNKKCDRCPIYCQEGYFTVRVATDGNVTTCPDYWAKLPYIDGLLEIKTGKLYHKINDLMQALTQAEKKNTLGEFFRRYDVKLINNNEINYKFI